jgi:DNA-directed RNA polymerase subunit RPC12/RpoP
MAILPQGNTKKAGDEKPMVDYKKYFCNKCKYKFRFKLNSPQSLKCPNCGGTNLVEDKFDIDRVIKESSSSRYDS